MASVERLKSGRWRILIWDRDKKRRVRWTLPKSVTSRRTALSKATAAQAALDRGSPGLVEHVVEGSTVGTFVERLVEHAELNNTGGWVKFVRRTGRLFVESLGGDRRPAGVAVKDCRDFMVRRQRAGDSASTLRKRLYVLRGLFRRAVEDHVVESSPMAGIKGPPEPARPPTFMSAAEFAAIYDAAPADRGFRYLLLMQTGARIVEARRAVWGDVDFWMKRIHIRNSHKGAGVRLAVRAIRIGDMLLRLLKERKGRPKSLIFPGSGDSSAWRRDMAVDCVKACVDRYTLSDFRDTFGSLAAQAGLSLHKIRDLMGHATVATTERYAHRLRDLDDGIVAAVAIGMGSPDGDGKWDGIVICNKCRSRSPHCQDCLHGRPHNKIGLADDTVCDTQDVRCLARSGIMARCVTIGARGVHIVSTAGETLDK